MGKPKVGLLGLTLELYDDSFPDLRPGREEFARRLVKMLEQEVIIDFPGACSNREGVDATVSKFEAQGYDAILIILLTYAPSLIAAPALMRTRLPIIIWNTQEAIGILPGSSPELMIQNHGVHGVQDLCSVLGRAGRKFMVITGHWQNGRAVDRLIMLLRAAKAVSVLRRSRIGLLGYPMQDMGDFCLDETAFLTQIGPSVVHIPLEELADLVWEAPKSSVAAIIERDRKRFDLDATIAPEEHNASARTEWAIRELIARHQLDAWAQHFTALASNKRIPTLPFLAASKLMEEGVTYGAEGDVTVAAACLVIRELVGDTTFTEMFTMDFEDQALFMSHMGELNLGMARENEPIKVIRKSFPMVKKLPPPTPLFALRPGDATLLSLTTGPEGRFKFVIAEGKVMDFPRVSAIDAPNFKWKPDCGLEEFLDAYASAGGSHHLALGYGELGEALTAVGEFLGVDVIRVI